MITVGTNKGVCFVLNQHDIDRMRGGHPIITQDRSILLYFTPDMKFTEDALQDMLAIGASPIDLDQVVQIIDLSKNRKPK